MIFKKCFSFAFVLLLNILLDEEAKYTLGIKPVQTRDCFVAIAGLFVFFDVLSIHNSLFSNRSQNRTFSIAQVLSSGTVSNMKSGW